MGNPKIKIKSDQLDRVLDGLSIASLLFLILTLFSYYRDLPETIAIHFDGAGEADGYGEKDNILILGGVGIVLFISLYTLSFFPHLYNYPVAITADNASRQYKLGVKLMKALNLFTTGLFTYLTYSTIQTALGNWDGPGIWFLPVTMTFTTVLIVTYLVMANRK